MATDLDLESDRQWRNDLERTAVRKQNLRTAYKIDELVHELDWRVPAGERPFGLYLERIGDYSAPLGSVYDFEQVWKTRFNWLEDDRKTIERFGCQLNWETQEGKPGYWNANKDKLPFAQEFAILSHIQDEPWVQALAACGLFIKFFHGNKITVCGDVDWCRKCNWNLRIKPKQRSYSPGTWLEGGHWYGYTISYETDPRRARAIGRLITEEDYHIDNPDSAIYREAFRPPNWNVWGGPGLDRVTPDYLQLQPETDDPVRRLSVQYASRKFLGACQHSIGALVHGDVLDGAEQSCEVALGFMPFRMRWHVHGIGCSKLHGDPQFIANAIKEEVDERLARLTDRRKTRREEWPLNQRLYANVMVVKFVEHEQLLAWIAYIHKTVNYWEPVSHVYLRPDCLQQDQRLHPLVQVVLSQEIQAMREWIDETFTAKDLTLDDGDGTRRLKRSFVWGCLRFGDGDEFIRFETESQCKRRHERAEQQRERREKKKERDRLARQLEAREDL